MSCAVKKLLTRPSLKCRLVCLAVQPVQTDFLVEDVCCNVSCSYDSGTAVTTSASTYYNTTTSSRDRAGASWSIYCCLHHSEVSNVILCPCHQGTLPAGMNNAVASWSVSVKTVCLDKTPEKDWWRLQCQWALIQLDLSPCRMLFFVNISAYILFFKQPIPCQVSGSWFCLSFAHSVWVISSF